MKQIRRKAASRCRAVRLAAERLEPRRLLAVSITADASFTTLENSVIAFKIARADGGNYSRGDVTSIRIKATNKELLQPNQRLFLELGVADDASANPSGVTGTTTTYYSPFASADGPVFSLTTAVGTDASWGGVRLSRRGGTQLSMLVNQYFVLRDNEFGLHSFTSFVGQTPTGAERIDFARLRTSLSDALFRQWSVEDNRSGTLPTAAEIVAAQYPDASFRESPVRLGDGTYYSKYEQAAYLRDTDTAGVFGTDGTNAYGAFFVNPTNEANTGGANRQELMVHPTTYGPIVLGMLHGRHYGAPGIALALNQTRVFPPHYLAFNYGPAATTTLEGLRAQAKAMVPGLTGGNNAFYKTVMASFSDTLSYLPFEPASRGRFQGRLISHRNRSLSNATVILSDPNTDSQLTNEGYQYSTRTDSGGYFDLPNLHPGTYRLTIQRDGDYGEFQIENFVVTANTTIGGGRSSANTWFVTAEGLRRYTDNTIVMPGTFSYGGSNYGDFGADLFTIGTFDRSGKEYRFGDTRSSANFTGPDNYAYRRSVNVIQEDIRTAYPNGLAYQAGTSGNGDIPFIHWSQIGGHVPFAPYSVVTPAGTSTYSFDISFPVASKPVTGQLATLSIGIAGLDTSRLAARVYDATGALTQTLFIHPYTYDPLYGNLVRRSSAGFRQGISGISALGLTQAGTPVQFDATKLSAGTNTIRLTLDSSIAATSRNVIYDALKLELSAAPPAVTTINVASASQTQAQAGYALLSGSTPVVKTGAGTLVVNQPNTLTGSTTVQAGSLQLAHGTALASSQIVPVAGGRVAVAPALSTTVGGLDPTAGGLIDVGNGLMTVAAGLSTTLMRQALATGRGDGSWNGTAGITSTAAASALAQSIPRTVGWLDNGNGSVTVAFAAAGDTNLDWTVDVLDAANFLAGGAFDSGRPASWNEGDFGYDGVVDILDAADFLANALFDAGTYNAPAGAAASVSGVTDVLAPADFAMLAAAISASDKPPQRKPAIMATPR
jgi:rhamnogalacturonan endolyase